MRLIVIKNKFSKAGSLCLIMIAMSVLPFGELKAQATDSLGARQPEYVGSNFLWNGVYTKYRIGERLWYNGEYHVRTRDFVNEMAQLYLRIGLSYLVNNNFEITAGIVRPYYWVDESQYPENTNLDKVVPQFRFWQQYLFIQPVGRVKLYHQIRMEQRWRRDFIVDSPFLLTHRFRHKIMAYIPFSSRGLQTKTFFASLYNEIFIQAGKSIQVNFMEDNRTFAGVGYILNENVQLQAGYMYSIQQRFSGIDFNSRDIFRISVYHNFDFYYKKKMSQSESIIPTFY